MISIVVNGETRHLPGPLSCQELVSGLDLAGKRIAVERNGEIVPRSRLWPRSAWPTATGSRSSSPSAAAERHPLSGTSMKPTENLDALTIAGKAYRSRLLVGTGKYRDFAETRAAIEASGAEIVTVAIRRTNIGQNPNEPSLLDVLPPSKYTILPNTAGCYTADDAVRTLRLARELLDGHDLVKLEVLGDPKTLFPNMPETLAAAEDARQGRLQGDGLLQRRPHHRQAARGDRLRRGDAARLADRLGHGHPQSRGTCRSSSTTRRCRCSSMPAWAPPPMPRSRWSSAATAC